ncbi:MAG: SagB/ThcOx family dehydrogenase [Zoogloeaceae bacterium]|nr:SagB/ThcOx family dehydrogenase [Rhodocyclaceae bacterium]MCP5236811.1 SagB/ThcOx family dehydrogenase [Zoogloeaceae bacterium]
MSGATAGDGRIEAVLAYHEATRHRLRAYAPGPCYLDWDAQPDPFRRWHPAPAIELPLIDGNGPGSFDALHRQAVRPQAVDARSLGLFLELALGLSAWKRLGAERWPLRNNPSSGNLHPTEGYLLLWRRVSATIPPGLYHYAPHEHALECRATLPDVAARKLASAHPGSFGAIAWSSIVWREAWKYGARAYRYCQLDLGHALGAARYAAAALGWMLRADPAPGDRQLASLLGLDRETDFADVEREHPEMIALVGDRVDGAPDWAMLATAWTDWQGQASRLSAESVVWPEIARVVPVVVKPVIEAAPLPPVRPIAQPPAIREVDAAWLIRSRRSAQRMDGVSGISAAAFRRLLTQTLATSGVVPLDAFPYPPAIHLAVFAHRVEGLDTGLYLLLRDAGHGRALVQAITAADGAARSTAGTSLPLYRVHAPADLGRTTSALACHQGIAGHGAFALAMIADFGPVLRAEGAWAWRRLHWEAGLIGQVLYLEAEAVGLRGTGIGCFFDDEVMRTLGLAPGPQARWQVVYQFTVGRPVDDARLVSEHAYGHLPAHRRTSGGWA